MVQRLREETRVVEYAIQYYKDIRTRRITEEWHVTRQFDAANKKRYLCHELKLLLLVSNQNKTKVRAAMSLVNTIANRSASCVLVTNV